MPKMTRSAAFQPRRYLIFFFFADLLFVDFFSSKMSSLYYSNNFIDFFPYFCSFLTHSVRKRLIFSHLLNKLHSIPAITCYNRMESTISNQSGFPKCFKPNTDFPLTQRVMPLKWSHSRWIAVKFKIINVQYSSIGDKFHCAYTHTHARVSYMKTSLPNITSLLNTFRALLPPIRFNILFTLYVYTKQNWRYYTFFQLITALGAMHGRDYNRCCGCCGVCGARLIRWCQIAQRRSEGGGGDFI